VHASAPGVSTPDFLGIGDFAGLRFDVTTIGQVDAHVSRFGTDLIVGTYLRPTWFDNLLGI
jgi:hypothetical protein